MRPPQRRSERPPGLHYDARFVGPKDYAAILEGLGTIHPIWEQRYSTKRPPPEGQAQRPLLRPVYWLGNWQFACLDYYRPPEGVHNRCVSAEPFPPVLAKLVRRVEDLVHRRFPAAYLPDGWRLNTCLVNLYGDRIEKGKRTDLARVGEHKDFEPGPVASISVGERAMCFASLGDEHHVACAGATGFDPSAAKSVAVWNAATGRCAAKGVVPPPMKAVSVLAAARGRVALGDRKAGVALYAFG